MNKAVVSLQNKFVRILILVLVTGGLAQNTLNIQVMDQDADEPLAGANVMLRGTQLGAASDEKGRAVIQHIPNGNYQLVASYMGYEQVRKDITLPRDGGEIISITMHQTDEFMQTLYVSSTHTTRSIKDNPTRIEVIAEEELNEQAVMNSANVAMLLRETTGILVQQTSQLSANAGIRIQGLDARHTLILKDGFPLYDGFGSGLSIMMIPPLDLSKVEVIKGSHSTLYGGGAIAGVVNLFSKVPEDEPELSIIVNQTSALGSTVNGYYVAKKGRLGITLYGSAGYQKPYDPDHDDFSNLPETNSLNLNPTLFWDIDKSTSMRFSVNSAWDDRKGGDMKLWDDGDTSSGLFYEKNRSLRLSGRVMLDHRYSSSDRLSVKASIRKFEREIDSNAWSFNGVQYAGFSEILYDTKKTDTEWILGGNLLFDDFNESDNPVPRDMYHHTAGVFVQNLWDLNREIAVESGLRTDWNSKFGTFVLPRISLLCKISPKLNTRFGGGLGYQIPTLFIDTAEEQLYQDIQPIDVASVQAERSRGIQWDVNWRGVWAGFLGVSVNQLFFMTELDHMLVLGKGDHGNQYAINNTDSPALNRGAETNVKLSWNDFSLYANYAFIDARIDEAGIRQQKPLTPKHNFGAALMFEQDDGWRIGFECYYIDHQWLYDRERTPDYWMAGFMIMREFEKASVFLNFENFTDVKQSNYGPVYTPPRNSPVFSEIWAPMDGFVANAGFKIRIK